MNPFSKIHLDKNKSVVEAENSLLEMLVEVRGDIDKLKSRDNPNYFAISKYENLLTLIHQYINSVEKEHNFNIQIIRKQALIIDINRVEFPTINQSMGSIEDIYLTRKGRTEEIGNNYNFPINIPVI